MIGDSLGIFSTCPYLMIQIKCVSFCSSLVFLRNYVVSFHPRPVFLVNPCKNGTGILARSRQDPGKILAGIPARFWPPGFPLPAGMPAGIPGGNRKSRRPKSRRVPGENLAGIPGGKRKSRRPKSRRVPGENLAGILGGKQNSRRPKSRWVPGENLAGILGGKRNSWRPRSRRVPGENLARKRNSRRLKSR